MVGYAIASLVNPQQVLPLAEVTHEAQALGNLKSRDQRSFDLLAAFAGSQADR